MSIILSVFLFNLVVGNAIVGILTIAESDPFTTKVIIHIAFSVTAVLLLLSQVKFFQQKRNLIVLVLFSILVAFLVPTVSIYVLFAGYGLWQLEFGTLLKGLPISIIVGLISWYFWLPLGIINSAFFIAYRNKLKKDTIETSH